MRQSDPREARRSRARGGLALLVLLLTAPVAPAVTRAVTTPAFTKTGGQDEETCPYCGEDPERMAAAGIVSHGGFDFGRGTTETAEELFPEQRIVWIETAHFELGVALPTYRLVKAEKAKIKAELADLGRSLPAVSTRARELDPWLRAHLYAQRLQRLWTRVQELLQVEDADFPDGSVPWQIGTPYRGEGPHLGQKGKFEVMLFGDEASHQRFLSHNFGLSTRVTQRWNIPDENTLTVVIHTGDPRLRSDDALHGHLHHALGINLLDGYEYYGYDTPVWLREGLGHFLERELDPRHNSFSYSEGAISEKTMRSGWSSQVRRMIHAGSAPTLAEMVHLRTFAELDLRHHYASWSMTKFLVDEYPAGYACLNAELHGIKNSKGLNDGGRMTDRHRRSFARCVGLSYAEFDQAWREWAMRQEDAPHPRRRSRERSSVEKRMRVAGGSTPR